MLEFDLFSLSFPFLQLIQYPDLIRPCLGVAGNISGNIVDIKACLDFCATKNLRPIQTIVLADQLDDVFEVLNNPATTIARYTLDVRKSFKKLMEDEEGAVILEQTEVSENLDIPDFQDVTSPGDDEQIKHGKEKHQAGPGAGSRAGSNK